MIEISKFFGDKGSQGQEATIYMNNEGFFATTKSKTGVYYTTRFDTEQLAEDFCEEWVNKAEDFCEDLVNKAEDFCEDWVNKNE